MKSALTLAALLVAAPAWADDGKPRDYCPDRPGLGTPACTIDPGRVSVETALVDWMLDKQGGDRTDTVLIGDTLVRIGLTDSVEAQIGWTPYGVVRDRSDGMVDRRGRIGDVTLGLKANFANPDGEGLSVAAQPFATLPVGRRPIGAGDWGAGLIVPVTYDLSKAINVQFVPEIDAAVDEDGHGRHFAGSGLVGLSWKLDEKLTIGAEGQVLRDDDPSGRTTQALASAFVAYKANDDLQLDIGGVAGLNRDAPDAEIYLGVSRQF